MIVLQGKYNTAKVFTDNIEPEAISQIIQLLNQEFAAGSQIRIMPDTHADAGCTIGTTMTIQDKVVPYMVGVDIGCGMGTVRLADKDVDLQMLDTAIHKTVPSGFNIHASAPRITDQSGLQLGTLLKHKGLPTINACIKEEKMHLQTKKGSF